MREHPRVVIVGGGFGGLAAARALAHSPVDVLLLDRHNYHTFLPLLYQVAAAELGAHQIAHPVRSILRQVRNAEVLMLEVQRVDLEARLVEADGRSFAYDYLVLALGSISNFFGIPGAAEHALPLRVMDEALALRGRILCGFEQAVLETDPERIRRLLTVVIVGGGPTGVEFAGALAELIYGPLRKDYPGLDFRQVRLVLVEAADSLLAGLPKGLQEYTLQRLRRMKIDVCLRATVSEVSAEAVHLQDGQVIPAETVVWTAGVRGDPLLAKWGLPTARSGRVPVAPSLQVAGHPEVYVIGDLAYLEEEGRPLPMIAPVAIQQGSRAGHNIARQVAGKEPEPFRYHDRGTMVTIGRNAAVASVLRANFTGFIAWVIWLAVHLFNLIGFRNRLLVLISWAWDYLTYERAVRLILPVGRGAGGRGGCR